MKVAVLFLAALFTLPALGMIQPEEPQEVISSSSFIGWEKLGVKYLDQLDWSRIAPQDRWVRSDSWDDPTCESHYSHYQERLAIKHEAPHKIKLISSSVGHGVFANQDFTLCDFIGEYTGYVDFSDAYVGLEPSLLKYLFRLGLSYTHPARRIFVDAREGGNFTRFVNHSYTPNLSPIRVTTHDGMVHVVFIVTEKILKGDQFFINYGEGYWRQQRVEPVELK
jgi:hypothetical protein